MNIDYVMSKVELKDNLQVKNIFNELIKEIYEEKNEKMDIYPYKVYTNRVNNQLTEMFIICDLSNRTLNNLSTIIEQYNNITNFYLNFECNCNKTLLYNTYLIILLSSQSYNNKSILDISNETKIMRKMFIRINENGDVLEEDKKILPFADDFIDDFIDDKDKEVINKNDENIFNESNKELEDKYNHINKIIKKEITEEIKENIKERLNNYDLWN